MVHNVNIHKENEIFSYIETSEDILNELYDFFSYEKQYFNKYRKQYRNTKVRLFKKRTHQLYIGLLPYLEFFCKEKGYNFSYMFSNTRNTFSLKDTIGFVKTLKLTSKGKRIIPYDHQLMALHNFLIKKRTLLISPTGSGKSLICYMIVRFLENIFHKSGKKILIIVPTTNLVNQLYSDFIDYSSENNWNVENKCHRIYSGHEKDTTKRIIISTWQSLNNMHRGVMQTVGGVIVDETHGATSRVLTELLEASTNAGYRIGMTGTLDGTEIHKLHLEGLFGTLYQNTTTKELIDKKELSRFKINCVLLNHSNSPIEKLSYHDELKFLIDNDVRNNFICNLAMNQKNNTLILYQFVKKHGLKLKEILENISKGSKNIYFIYGEVEADVREQIRQIAEKEDNAIIVASYQTWSVGSNIKNLHNIIFASPSKGRIRVLQSIGRGLRLNDNKDIAKLFDIADRLTYNESDVNHTFNHLLRRLEIYKSEQFPVKLYEVTI